LRKRHDWFLTNFENLQKAMGDRIITINANKTPEEVWAQVLNYTVVD